MKYYFLLFIAIAGLDSAAQKKAKPDNFMKTITPADLKKHLYIVASAEMGGRETGTEGERKAAAYIETQFKNLGLQPGNNGSYRQYFNVYQDSLLNARIEVNGQKFDLDKDFNASIGSNISGTLKFSEVVYLPKDTTAIKSMDLAGKLVMFHMSNRNAINNLLRTKNVAGILSITGTYPRMNPASRKGNQTMNSFRRTLMPQEYTISENLARAIMNTYADSAKNNQPGIRTFAADVLLETQKTTNSLQSSNVIALLPGTDLKDEYLFITAHYDHIGTRNDTIINYGADDDGSGTVAVIEIAEAFVKAKAAGKGPRRSIVFMTVSGEEKGLWGSDYYSSHPVFPLEKTTADLNIDMIGRVDTERSLPDTLNYVYVVGDDKLSSELRTISESVNKKYTKLNLDYKFNDPNDVHNIYFRSDHYNFAKKGVPIIFYYDGMLKADYHRPTDTPDKINYNLHAKRAQLVFVTAWEMANRNEMVKRDRELPEMRRNRP